VLGGAVWNRFHLPRRIWKELRCGGKGLGGSVHKNHSCGRRGGTGGRFKRGRNYVHQVGRRGRGKMVGRQSTYHVLQEILPGGVVGAGYFVKALIKEE